MKQYTVSFFCNYDGAPAAQTVVVSAGECVRPPVFAPSREGYVFDGWYTDEGCEYEADFSQAVEYDTNFYARWKALDEVTETSGGCAGAVGGGAMTAGAILLIGSAFLVAKKSRKNKKEL